MTEPLLDRILGLPSSPQSSSIAPTRPSVGDVYTLLLPDKQPISWAVLHERPGDVTWCLAVPADTVPLLGDRDITATADTTGPVTLRCGRPTWIWTKLLSRSQFLCQIHPHDITRAEAILRGTMLGSGQDAGDADLIEWEAALADYGEALRLHQLGVAPAVVPRLSTSAVKALLAGSLQGEDLRFVSHARLGAGDNRRLLLDAVREALAGKADALNIPNLSAMVNTFLLATTARETQGVLALADALPPLEVRYNGYQVPDPEQVHGGVAWIFREGRPLHLDLAGVTVPGLLPGCQATLSQRESPLAIGVVANDCTVDLIPQSEWGEIVRGTGEEGADVWNLLPPASLERLTLTLVPAVEAPVR